MTPWRECGYCGAKTQDRLCSKRCGYLAQGLRDVEVRGLRRPGKSGCHISDWEIEEREIRLQLAMRMVMAGCPPDIAIDEAGFTADERVSTYRTLHRRGARWESLAGWECAQGRGY